MIKQEREDTERDKKGEQTIEMILYLHKYVATYIFFLKFNMQV